MDIFKVIIEDTQYDFDKVFSAASNNSKPNSDSEQSRIDMAFKRQESQLDFKSQSDLKSSSSMHGISNPNYGHSPTTRYVDL